MNERLPNDFLYEQCDIPQGQSLTEWRTRQSPPPPQRTHVASGMFAALFGRFPATGTARDDRSE